MIPALALVYLSFACVALAASIIAGRWPLFISAVSMLTSWAITNAADIGLGFSRSPLVIPEADAAIGMLLTLVAVRYRSKAAVAVVCLFVVEAVAHVGFLSQNMAVTKIYIVTLNMIFSAQCLIVGIAGVRARLTDSPPRRDGGAYLSRGRRSEGVRGLARR